MSFRGMRQTLILRVNLPEVGHKSASDTDTRQTDNGSQTPSPASVFGFSGP